MDAGDKIDIDDAIRWLGSRKPVAFAWYGLAILEIAAACFILVKAYVIYDTQISDNLDIKDVVELLRRE
jgi:hypothetical protein